MPSLTSEPESWVEIPRTGHLNRLFIGQGDRAGMVWRLNSSRAIPGIDRRRESVVLSALQRRAPWVPELRAWDEQGCLLTLIHGQVGTGREPFKPLLSVLALLQQIREVPPLDYSDLLRRYRQRLGGDARWRAELDTLEEYLARLPSVHCLVHHDLHPGNTLWQDLTSSPRLSGLIDWEYAGLGNPWLDMAMVQRHWRVPASKFAELPVAEGLEGETLQRYLQQADRCNRALEALWSAWVCPGIE